MLQQSENAFVLVMREAGRGISFGDKHSEPFERSSKRASRSRLTHGKQGGSEASEMMRNDTLPIPSANLWGNAARENEPEIPRDVVTGEFPASGG